MNQNLQYDSKPVGYYTQTCRNFKEISRIQNMAETNLILDTNAREEIFVIGNSDDFLKILTL